MDLHLRKVDVEARKVDVEARRVDVEARRVDVEVRRIKLVWKDNPSIAFYTRTNIAHHCT